MIFHHFVGHGGTRCGYRWVGRVRRGGCRSREKVPFGGFLEKIVFIFIVPALNWVFLPDHTVALGDDNLLAQVMCLFRREEDRPEPFTLQYLLPGPGRQSGAARDAQYRVLVEPPAFQQAEGQVGKQGLTA